MHDIIDTNVYLSRWPFKRLPLDDPAKLVARLRSRGVVAAWAGLFDGILHKDIAGVNQRLAQDCQEHGSGLLVPFGAVNLTLPDWEEDVRRCHEEHGMPGIRLHPNYHGYTLDDPRFARLLEIANQRKLIVQITLTMEDERVQHPMLRVSHVDTGPLLDAIREHPDVPIVLLNAFRSLRPNQAAALAAAKNVFFEIAMLEGVGGVETLLREVPIDRVLFGSHAPLFVFESALGKLRESALGGAVTKAICSDNARRLQQRR
jgi:predicted TIM-barrel fold metal-dependent hydrolase